MDEEKKNYEIAAILAREEDALEVSRLAGQHGAEIRSEGQMRKLNLAYQIKGASQAYFVYFRAEAKPEDAKKMERDLGTLPAVLRYLIVSLPEVALAPAAGAEAAAEGAASMPKYRSKLQPRRPPAAEKKAYQPLSNEALEKKIEEISQ